MNLPREVFVDTSFFIALTNSRDEDHEYAVTLYQRLESQSVRKITSEYVLMELGDGLSRFRVRHLAQQVIASVQDDDTFEIVPASTDLFTQALHLFQSRPDKEWGMTDCSSFIVMQQMDLYAALTADHHFEQAGFLSLLRTNKF